MGKKTVRRVIFVGTVLLLTVFFVATHFDKKEYTRDHLEEYVRQMCRVYRVPGLSAAIIDGENEYYINYGEGIDENIKFELGSTTKAFTALGILRLEQEGKLSITDKVSDYIPWFRPTYKGTAYDITIEEFLCHTSGVPVWTISTIPEGEDYEEGVLVKTVENIKDVKLSSMPGTHHEYATINYDVLALIIENVTGEKYEKYISSEILDPLGMKESFFRTNDACAKNEVQGHKIGFFLPLSNNAPTYYGNTAAGYLVSSSSDLMKWMKNWTTESQDALGLANDVLSHDVSQTDHYFAGWNIYDGHVSHGGNNPNFSSQVIISRERNQGVFVLSNLAGSSATRIADGIYRLLLGETLRIGFQMDFYEFFDFMSILCVITLIYLNSLLREVKSRSGCMARIVAGVVFIVLALIVPVVLHYPYQMMYVWFPVTFCVAMLTGFVTAVLLILRGCFGYKEGVQHEKMV
ncbi:MAG: beta-lactamase family protein [Lachnospiraceae bacterium]|nr:beta-lactamase family protein [Lachnospiraceae bacterium]